MWSIADLAISSSAHRPSDGDAEEAMVNEHNDEEEPVNQDGEQGRQEKAVMSRGCEFSS